MNFSRPILAAAVAGLVTACASAPPASLIQARGDVSSALTSADPATYSRPELDEAHAKLDQAEAAARNDDMTSADQLSQEALADVRLSRSVADDNHARDAADQLSATVQTLQSETNRPLQATTPAPPAPPAR